jgi:hypothetical protein
VTRREGTDVGRAASVAVEPADVLPPRPDAARPPAGRMQELATAPAAERRTPTRTKREHAARYACPRCGAAAGEYCRRANGNPRLSAHAERHAAALAHGAPGAQPRDTQLTPRQGGRVTRKGRPEGEARSA